ncbi:MAG: hypothetical protein LBC71_02710 [Oscillospiraceae bacterium]|nr:hypothetical protein [Oscillospiraceae bacterium]
MKKIILLLLITLLLCSCSVFDETNNNVEEKNSINVEPPGITTSNIVTTTTPNVVTPPPETNTRRREMPSDEMEYGDFDYRIWVNGEIDLLKYRGNGGSVIIPDEIDGMPVTMMNNHVFPVEIKYESIALGKNIESFAKTNFIHCKYLENIYVHEENEYFTSVDGVLYTRDMSALLVYAAGKIEKEYTIPDGVKWIVMGAFSGNEHIKKVYLPKSLEVFGIYREFINFEERILVFK